MMRGEGDKNALDSKIGLGKVAIVNGLFPLIWLTAPFRTNYSLRGDTFTIKRPFRSPIAFRIEEFDEIGVETTDQGPFVEDVFWILKRGTVRIRIGDPHPVFQELMSYFETLRDFDWQPFIDAQSRTDNRYFVCWQRAGADVTDQIRND